RTTQRPPSAIFLLRLFPRTRLACPGWARRASSGREDLLGRSARRGITETPTPRRQLAEPGESGARRRARLGYVARGDHPGDLPGTAARGDSEALTGLAIPPGRVRIRGGCLAMVHTTQRTVDA